MRQALDIKAKDKNTSCATARAICSALPGKTGPDGGHCAVVGMQWGDEGKGKIVDLLCGGFDYVVRYNGGANAGHSIEVGDQRYALHLIPSGILYPEQTNVLGNGVV